MTTERPISYPKFITFNGVDETVDIDNLKKQTRGFEHRFELGVLVSMNNTGTKLRYPSFEFIDELFKANLGCPIAVHLCGEIARTVAQGSSALGVGVSPTVAFEHQQKREFLSKVNLNRFSRIQINTKAKPLSVLDTLGLYGINQRVIIPTSDPDKFPTSTACDWLYDISHGEGIVPDKYPNDSGYQNFYTKDRLVGYAGGINLNNVSDIIQKINMPNGTIVPSFNYWLDIESGVRSSSDRFSPELLRNTFYNVYGTFKV